MKCFEKVPFEFERLNFELLLWPLVYCVREIPYTFGFTYKNIALVILNLKKESCICQYMPIL